MSERIAAALEKARRHIGAVIKSHSPLAMSLVEPYTFALAVIEAATRSHGDEEEYLDAMHRALSAWADVVLGDKP